MPGMLFVFANWCGHCARFKPTYTELDKRIGKDFDIMALEDKNMSTSVSQALGIQGFPTLKFVDQHGKITDEYNGARDLDSILGHICKFYHKCARQ